MRGLSDHERDMRDLRILEMLDQGLKQCVIAQRLGMGAGSLSRRIKDLREAME